MALRETELRGAAQAGVTPVARTTTGTGGLLGWWHAGTSEAKRALVAASLGWMLDSFDVMIYALVLVAVMNDLSMTPPTAGLLGSLTLVASAVGGMLFGVIADRFGRTRALIGSILIYSIFTAACGLSQSIWQLAVFRILLGLGMGGEWASGAALVSETWPAEHRGKALGIMQSSWAIGYGAAAVVTALVLPRWSGVASRSRRSGSSAAVRHRLRTHSRSSFPPRSSRSRSLSR
jgi:MFS family permease